MLAAACANSVSWLPKFMAAASTSYANIVYLLQFNELHVSGSSKIQTLMIFIEHVSLKVGVANTHWVIYALVSFIPACL